MAEIVVDTDLREVPWTINNTVAITAVDTVVDPPSDAVYIATDDVVLVTFELDADGTTRSLSIAGYHPVRVRFIEGAGTTSAGSFICYRKPSGDNGT